jgi:hypothetical protein
LRIDNPTFAPGGLNTVTNATTASTTTLAYAMVTLGGTWPTSNTTDITISSVIGSGITVASNIITLQNAGVYYLSANLGFPASEYAEYNWVNTSNVMLTGTNTGISVAPSTTIIANPAITAAGIITASANTQIKLRTGLVNGVVSAQAPYYYNVQIIQLR